MKCERRIVKKPIKEFILTINPDMVVNSSCGDGFAESGPGLEGVPK